MIPFLLAISIQAAYAQAGGTVDTTNNAFAYADDYLDSNAYDAAGNTAPINHFISVNVSGNGTGTLQPMNENGTWLSAIPINGAGPIYLPSGVYAFNLHADTGSFYSLSAVTTNNSSNPNVYYTEPFTSTTTNGGSGSGTTGTGTGGTSGGIITPGYGPIVQSFTLDSANNQYDLAVDPTYDSLKVTFTHIDGTVEGPYWFGPNSTGMIYIRGDGYYNLSFYEDGADVEDESFDTTALVNPTNQSDFGVRISDPTTSTGGTTGGTTSGGTSSTFDPTTCQQCIDLKNLLQCPEWDQYMGDFQRTMTTALNNADWQSVSNTMRDTMIPAMDSMLGHPAPPPALPTPPPTPPMNTDGLQRPDEPTDTTPPVTQKKDFTSVPPVPVKQDTTGGLDLTPADPTAKIPHKAPGYMPKPGQESGGFKPMTEGGTAPTPKSGAMPSTPTAPLPKSGGAAPPGGSPKPTTTTTITPTPTAPNTSSPNPAPTLPPP